MQPVANPIPDDLQDGRLVLVVRKEIDPDLLDRADRNPLSRQPGRCPPLAPIANTNSRHDWTTDRSASHAWFYVVTSWAIDDAPTVAPSASRIGEMVRETLIALESFRTPTV
jgi:hypothetical protein